jgi:hypothetical protein
MGPSFRCCLLLLALAASTAALAQTSIRTESIRPSPPSAGAATAEQSAQAAEKPSAHLRKAAAAVEIVTDLTRLPPAVAGMREQLLAAGRSGDLEKLAALMRTSAVAPVFTFGDDKDPVAFWKSNYPDSDGIEVLSILVAILETGFVRADAGTPQEMYVWPYFVGTPLKELSPAQKVELFRIVTGADYRDMADFGAYAFYRVGIAPDGAWHFFVAGD